MASNRITFFACDNGDASLIEAHGLTIMTDINYRQSEIEKDPARDFAPEIRKACNDGRLSVFVLTHPDEDHLRGFDEVFHLGKPDDRDEDPDEGDVRIIVNEIWCSPYAVDPNYKTEVSKPVLKEIARRKRLAGTDEGKKDGNRLRVMSAADGATEKLTSGVEWRLLAPTEEEADIPKAEAGASENSSNPSSLVIQWNVTVGSKTSKVILGGDSTVEIWERIHQDYGEEQVNWHILLAPHHCSRHSMGRKEIQTAMKSSFGQRMRLQASIILPVSAPMWFPAPEIRIRTPATSGARERTTNPGPGARLMKMSVRGLRLLRARKAKTPKT